MYALVGNLGQIELIKSFGMTPIGDFRLNITNSHTAAAYREMGIEFASEISPQELLVSAVVFARAILDEQAIRVFLADMLSSYLYPDFDDGDEYLSGEMES
jgi:hypothetical protein